VNWDQRADLLIAHVARYLEVYGSPWRAHTKRIAEKALMLIRSKESEMQTAGELLFQCRSLKVPPSAFRYKPEKSDRATPLSNHRKLAVLQ
jgi:hypothetical protein